MKLKTNQERLVMQSVAGKIHHPTLSHSGTFKLCHGGESRVLPSVGGITYNVTLGDCVYDMCCDHVEPGVSIRNSDDRENGALVMLACVGNDAVVVSGEAKGACGMVTGFHGGIDHTLLCFSPEDQEKMLPDDRILIRAWGQGLQLLDFPDILCTGVDPRLLTLLDCDVDGDRLVVPVAAKVPAHLMGAGQGMGSGYDGDYDIMTADREEVKRHGLDRLRYGDLVLLENCDNSYGRGYLGGAASIGVVVHSDCTMMGHGPGVTTLLTAKRPVLTGRLDPRANLADLYQIGHPLAGK